MTQSNEVTFRTPEDAMKNSDYAVPAEYQDAMQRLINNSIDEPVPSYTWEYINGSLDYQNAIDFYCMANDFITALEWDETIPEHESQTLRNSLSDFGKAFAQYNILDTCLKTCWPQNTQPPFDIVSTNDYTYFELRQIDECDIRDVAKMLDTVHNINPNAAFLLAAAIRDGVDREMTLDEESGLSADPERTQLRTLSTLAIDRYMYGREMTFGQAMDTILTDTLQEFHKAEIDKAHNEMDNDEQDIDE